MQELFLIIHTRVQVMTNVFKIMFVIIEARLFLFAKKSKRGVANFTPVVF